jgi:hypothetical protein
MALGGGKETYEIVLWPGLIKETEALKPDALKPFWPGLKLAAHHSPGKK